ncbi:MAG: hypothetical protein H7A25_10330 [Leptospiraceae bacterium]|nr:hypothetical protein [Leptospiraceae bacterium]MCP5500289.1 hypothetical protein [Leptospiraceae bacterium]
MSNEMEMTREEAYIIAMNEILRLSQQDSVSTALEEISKIPEDMQYKDAILSEMNKTKVFPDSLMKIITMILFLITERKEITRLYEVAMERYETIKRLTSKSRPTEDEQKIAKYLTDYILKVESIFEDHDKVDEGMVKELNRYMAELNLQVGDIGLEHLSIKLNNRSKGQMQPHLVNSLDKVYFQYKKITGILKRLIKISNYIIEDAEKKAV